MEENTTENYITEEHEQEQEEDVFPYSKKTYEESPNNRAKQQDYRNRIFINHVDHFNAKHFAAYITDQVQGALKIMGGNDMDEVAAEQLPEEPPQSPTVAGQNYVVVGTLKEYFHKPSEDISEIIHEEDQARFLEEVMSCGIIIFDITQDETQIEKALSTITAIEEELERIKEEGPKTYKAYEKEIIFILLSTVMTWAKTKPLDPDDPDLAFSEIDYKRRRPHNNYKQHINCERTVVMKGRKYKEKLKTYVICCGIIYGMEEEDLDPLFRMAWYNLKDLPIVQPGKNFVPLIHINDLSKIIHGLIENPPAKPQFILAVEQTPCTSKQIVKALSKNLGNGRTTLIDKADLFLYKEFEQKVFDRITVNLHMEPVFVIESLQIEWQNEMNLAENMVKIVNEYKEARKLFSKRVIVHGPPASGKTKFSNKLCKHYGLHYISIATMLQETVDNLKLNITSSKARKLAKEKRVVEKTNAKGDNEEEMAGEEEEEAEEEEDDDERLIEEWEEQVKDIQAYLTEDKRLPDEMVLRLMKNFIKSNLCQNQGYVMDGYPKSIEQAKALFNTGGEPGEGGEGDDDAGMVVKLLPDFVISLEASDEFLCERLMQLPEADIQDTKYDEENMVRRLAQFRELNDEDNTMLNFFNEIEIHPIVIDIMEISEKVAQQIFTQEEDLVDVEIEKILQIALPCLGPPVGFALSIEEELELNLLKEEKKKIKEHRAKIVNEVIEGEAAVTYHMKMEQWTEMLEKLQMEEEKIIIAESQPLRGYLMNYVFPVLTKALIATAKAKPRDPIDFLAEYLFKENPEGKMFDPSYTREGEMIITDYENTVQELIDDLV